MRNGANAKPILKQVLVLKTTKILVAFCGDTTPCRMTAVTSHSHVLYKQMQAPSLELVGHARQRKRPPSVPRQPGPKAAVCGEVWATDLGECGLILRVQGMWFMAYG